MSDLPAGWSTHRLDEIADIRLGRQRSPKNHLGPQMRSYLRAANVGWAGLKLDDVKSMNFSDSEMGIYQLRPGDVLLSEASGSPGEVGKPALWSGELDECAFQNTLIRIRPHDVDSLFLLHYFRYVALTGGFTGQARGVGIHHLGRARIARWLTPVPPPDEQRRIVDILEDHLSRLDAAHSSLTSAHLRLSVLHKSVLMSLIPDVSVYPAHWSRSTVSDAGKVTLGRQRHPDWHNGANMHPYLRVANVFEDRLDLKDVKEMHWPDDSFERFRLKPGDVLLNEGQSPEFLGRPAMYRGEPIDIAFTNTLIKFQAHDHVLPEFALLVFRRHMHAGRFARESRITTNIAHLSASRLKPIEFPIPPLDEQKQLAGLAEHQLGDAARLGDQVGLLKLRNRVLRRALLSAAFSGRLTGRTTDMEIVEEMAGV